MKMHYVYDCLCDGGWIILSLLLLLGLCIVLIFVAGIYEIEKKFEIELLKIEKSAICRTIYK